MNGMSPSSRLRSPIFIGGQPRSGTTLFRVLLNRHHRIACGPEVKFLADPEFREWHDCFSNEWIDRVEKYGLDRQAVDHAMAALVDNLFTRYAVREGKQRWAEKTPNNILSIDYLFRLFPSAQFVHLIRDPRDTYCSIQEKVRKGKERWKHFTPTYSAQQWCEAILTGERWRGKPKQYFELHYENLVTQPEKSMRQALEFLHEPWNPDILTPEADNQEVRAGFGLQRQTPHAQSIGRWRREMAEDDVRTIQSIAGELMTEYGYEVAPVASQWSGR